MTDALAIEVRGLTKRYGSKTVVEGLTLEVPRGAIYGLLGPNGSGKTTTLSCALGLMRPTAGTSKLLGEPSERIHRLQGRLGVVFDTAIALPGLTATQNLDYVQRLLGHRRGHDHATVLEAVGLAELANQRARSMSLGQQKRLAIASALLGQPELLVLDEPLSGLDTLGVRRMLRLFQRLQGEGVTLLLSSHRLHEMQTCVTHAGILVGGEIAKSGTLDELLGRDAQRQRLTVDDAARATAVLRDLGGIECTALDDEDGLARLEVRGHSDLPALHRALVDAGVGVHASEPIVESLQSVFERLVDEREAQEVA